MPIAKVQLPDGRIAKFEVPEGTTQEQVMAFVQQNQDQFATPAQTQAPEVRQTRRGEREVGLPQAPDKAAIFAGLPADLAQELEEKFTIPSGRSGRAVFRPDLAQKAADLERIRLQNPYLAQQIEETGPLEAAAVAAGRGITTVGRGVGLVDQEPEDERKIFSALSGEQPFAFTAGELVGETAPFLAVGGPVTAAGKTVATKALATGALGATEAGVIARGRGAEGEDVAKAAVLGFVTGGAVPLGGAAASRLGSKAGQRSVKEAAEEAIKNRAAKSAAAKEAIPDIDDAALKEFFDDPAALGDLQESVRREAFEKLGVTPTRAQTTRDPALFQRQVDVFRDAAKDNKVRRALVEQEKILSDRVNGEIDALGGVPERAGQSLSDSIINKNLELDADISAMYKAARDAAPDAKNVRFSDTARSIIDNMPIDSRTDRTVKAMRDEMKRLGFLDPDGKASRLTTVDAAENLRIFANKLFDGANPLAKSFLRDIKDSIDDDVMRAAGKDYFQQARKAKADMMAGLSARRGHKFDARAKSLVKDVLEGKVQPEQIGQAVGSRSSQYKAKEILELREYLHSGKPEHIATGAQAWNDVRASVLAGIKDQAFKGPLNELGVKSLSRDGLEKALKSVGPDKLKILFTKEELGFLRDLAKISTLKEPVSGVRVTPSKPAIARVEQAIRNSMPIVRDWVPDISGSIQSKADQKTLLKLVDQAEEIAKQNEVRFIQRMKQSRGLTATPILAAPAAAVAQDREQ